MLNSDEEVTIVGEKEKGPGQATALGDKLTWHFMADKVNDFAWATACLLYTSLLIFLQLY